MQLGVPAAPRTAFGAALAVREFRALFAAHVLSLVGDQLARVAVTVLVYERTGSPLLTGLAYALGFLPAVLGGPLLGGVADRFPRRTVMIICDLWRAALVAGMALTDDHVVVLCVLLVGAELLASPFSAARAALLADVLTGEAYLAASALGNITFQVAQVAGFAAAGAVIATVGSSATLLVDAATFMVSAALLRAGVQPRPPALGAPGAPSSPARQHSSPLRLLLTDPQLRRLVGYALLCGCYSVPEALAAPLADGLHRGPTTIGVLMAAQPTGAALGALLLTRLVGHDRRLALMGPLAVLASGALLAFVRSTNAPFAVALLVLSGLGTAYQLPANAAFVTAVPAAVRGRAFGLVQSGIVAVQGVGFLLAGALAERLPPHTVVALAGAAGTAGALALLRRSPTQP